MEKPFEKAEWKRLMLEEHQVLKDKIYEHKSNEMEMKLALLYQN